MMRLAAGKKTGSFKTSFNFNSSRVEDKNTNKKNWRADIVLYKEVFKTRFKKNRHKRWPVRLLKNKKNYKKTQYV